MEKDDLKKFIEYDYYATPLFDGLQVAFSKEVLEKSGNTDIFLGVKLFKIVEEFVPLYHAKCKEFGEEPQEIRPLDFNHIVPYCSAVVAASCFDDMITCVLYLQEHFGKYKEVIVHHIGKIDELKEIIKGIDDDPDLRHLIGLYAEIVDTVDKIIMLDYKMGRMVLDEKWQDIADALNVYVDKLKEAKLANELNHFTADDAREMSKLADLYALPPFIFEENRIAKAQDFNKLWFLVDMKSKATRAYTYMERKEMGMLTEEELKAESEILPFPPPYSPVADFGGEEPGPF